MLAALTQPLLLLILTISSAIARPGGIDPPSFYLIATSPGTSYHLQYLRGNRRTANLVTGTPVKLFQDGNTFKVKGTGPDLGNFAMVNSSRLFGPDCFPGGDLLFVDQPTNDCAASSPYAFKLSSFAPLGSSFGYGSVGGFYACGGGWPGGPVPGTVIYNPTDPGRCAPIQLWTVPAL